MTTRMHVFYEKLLKKGQLPHGKWVALTKDTILLIADTKEEVVDAAFVYLGQHPGAKLLIRCVGVEPPVEKIR